MHLPVLVYSGKITTIQSVAFGFGGDMNFLQYVSYEHSLVVVVVVVMIMRVGQKALMSPRFLDPLWLPACYQDFANVPSSVFNTRLVRLLTFLLTRSPGFINILPQSLYLLQESTGQRHKMCELSSLSSPQKRHSLLSVRPSLYKWPLRASSK